nr:SLC13 family permease [Methanolinea mesophila]
MVFLLIAIRQVGRYRFRIWQIMLFGAVIVLITGQISPVEALASINPEVMIFLFGMFVVGGALVESGSLSAIAYSIFRHARTGNQLILFILFGLGFFSAVLMNDTIAVIGTPLVLALAGTFGVSPKGTLLALCTAITIGSIPSPIGNPQNVLVASYAGFANPFVTFAVYLAIPTLISLVIAYLLLGRLYRFSSPEEQVQISIPEIIDPALARLAKISLLLVFGLSGMNILAGFGIFPFTFPLSLIAVVAALPVLLGSGKRFRILASIDWGTLVFFVSMFILMESVYLSGIIQQFLTSGTITGIPAIFCSSVLVSQLVSNVPFVALFYPLIAGAGLPTAQILALAAGSTLAGTLTILGAASNVIVIQSAERHGIELSFWEFLRLGIPLTALSGVVYVIFLLLFS